MEKFDKLTSSFWDALIRKKDIIFFCVTILIGMIIRICGLDMITGDYYFYNTWIEDFRDCGLFGLEHGIGDYSIFFQTVFFLLSFIPGKPMYIYKMMSVMFDLGQAIAIAFFVCDPKKENLFKEKFNISFALAFLLPTIVLNSAYWGQFESCYSFFLVLTLIALHKEKFMRAFAWLGLAFAWKFQCIILVPFVLAYCIGKKKLNILHPVITIFVFWATSIPGIIAGRSKLDAFRVYLSQSSEYGHMYLKFTSFWVLVGDDYDLLKNPAILLTVMLCGIGLYAIISGKKKIGTYEEMLNTAAWFVWTATFFLPAMHERYSYFLDLIWILLACKNTRYIKYLVLTALINLINYGSYLFGIPDAATIPFAVIMLCGYILYSYEILKADNS
ncbi:MAG: hypothetical protein K5871_05030 [Lachnospiraceae bacterium]|nr:hypothetical protein [Lachnospiraceae bacterium]